MPTLAEVLIEKRKEKNWSLRDAERAIGIHNAHLAQIENGTIARPSPTLLYSLAEAYGLEFKELMRLAGHVEQDAGSRAGAALRALHGLSPEKQEEAVKYLIRLQKDERKDRKN
jgi:transcriptional regulator with XRE-family HTH domain